MKSKKLILFSCLIVFANSLSAQLLFKAPAADVHTRWISPENPTGEKGKAGLVNKGAKGRAFINILDGTSQELMHVKGAGIIHRIWMSGTIPRSKEQRRKIRIEMYWDNDPKPAVSVPVGDFFGLGLGLSTPFENEFFSNPEGRSFNASIPMPFRKSARIVLVNESGSHALVWYDINYSEMKSLPADALYFHAFWNRNTATTIGEDYTILPRVEGYGRFLGTNIGVIGNSDYRGVWFGEGEVKVYLDGDQSHPTLSGTGTEDYIGSGWGQGVYANRYQGSLVSDSKNDLYCFYRYHVKDPIYFHKDCKVTIQQIGNASLNDIKRLIANGVTLKPVWIFKQGATSDIFHLKGAPPEQIALLDQSNQINLSDSSFSNTFGGNFYRSDDVSATAYFYLNKTSSNLPIFNNTVLAVQGLDNKVWKFSKE